MNSWTSFCNSHSILDGVLEDTRTPTFELRFKRNKTNTFMELSHSLVQKGAHVYKLDDMHGFGIIVDGRNVPFDSIIDTLRLYADSIYGVISFNIETLNDHRHTCYCLDPTGDNSGFYP